MKTLKRAVASSFFALSLFAAPAAVASAQENAEFICVYPCPACGAYHVVVLAPSA